MTSGRMLIEAGSLKSEEMYYYATGLRDKTEITIIATLPASQSVFAERSFLKAMRPQGVGSLLRTIHTYLQSGL